MDAPSPMDMEILGQKHDPGGMLGRAFQIGGQVQEVIELSHEWTVPRHPVKNVLIMGMGGSAIGGDLIGALSAARSPVPAAICRDYSVPAFVGPETLCIASSYSGNTEETLSAYGDCRGKGARILAVSTGGRLKEMAEADGFPHYSIPGGLQPRSALGYSFAALFVLMQKAGVFRGNLQELQDAVPFLAERADRWKSWKKPGGNPPLQTASGLMGRIPVVYGSPGWPAVMACRWKCQFNENSKLFSSWSAFPEMNHNEIVGWEAPGGITSPMAVLVLRHGDESPRIKARIDITLGLLKKTVQAEEIMADGDGDVQKLLYMVMFGDLLTIYLAYLLHRDPSEIDYINLLKDELARLPGRP